uniref:MFS domain-containing protein n=1 Tax=Wuchereria bancrofti TaxID=6293 RepID=A0A1I8EFC7_WUCBA
MLRKSQQTGEGGWTQSLLMAVASAAIGGSFQFGYHIGCVNVPAKVCIYVSRICNFHTALSLSRAITVGIFAVGGMIGGLGSGKMADWLGRKGAMVFNNVVAVLAAVLMTLAYYVNVYPLLIVGRLVIGINSGLSSGLVPMYLTEISPVNLRGSLGSVAQLLVTIGILFSQIIGLPQILGSAKLWPMVFGFTVVPVVFQIATLPLIPESPKYSLIVKNRAEQAEEDLKKLRGKDNVKAEIDLMKEEQAKINAVPKMGIFDLFRGNLLWPMIIAILMMLAQQFSGINVAMFFSTMIFEGAGLGEKAVYATLVMGLINVLMTVISVYLVDHPKCGRVMLLMIGLIGMFFSSIAIVIFISVYNQIKQATSGQHIPLTSDQTGNKWASYPACLFVFLFVIFFATGPGSIPWFFVSELFSSGARGAANSVAAATNWTANFLVGTSFEFLNQMLHQYTFLIFSGFLAFFAFFTWMYVPETKGRSVEDIQEELARGKSRFARNAA